MTIRSAAVLNLTQKNDNRHRDITHPIRFYLTFNYQTGQTHVEAIGTSESAEMAEFLRLAR